MTSSGLYIHIPFCASACPYCDFAFVVGNRHLVDRYVDALILEFNVRSVELGPNPMFQTVYFGGGTPSAIPVDSVKRLANALEREATVLQDAEITLEANPGDLQSFKGLAKNGINRLSLGVQAMSDRALTALGRNPTSLEREIIFEFLRQERDSQKAWTQILHGLYASLDFRYLN